MNFYSLTTRHIPRTIKKFSVKLLVLGLKGLISLKKCLTFFLLIAKKPAALLWKAVFRPLIALGYRVYLSIKRAWTSLVASAKDGVVHFFSNRYVVHVAVVALSFLVTATNLYARDATSADEVGRKSILSSFSIQEAEEEILIEEMVSQDEPGDISYIGDQALSVYDANDSIGDETLVESETEYISPIPGAVRFMPEPETATPAPPTRTKITEYVVEPGDVISTIAAKFGLRMASVLSANNLSARSLIRPGDKLVILPVDGVKHTAKKGDTVAKIAKTYSADEKKILEMNGLTDPSQLAIGMTLVVPDGKLPTPPAPKAPVRLAANLRDVFVPPAADLKNAAKMLWPTAARRITQYFRGSRHTGVDIAGPTGTPIYASADGVVEFSGWNRGGYGNMLIVNHQNGLYTRYAHASKLLVKVGDAVKKGDLIALIGSTGRSTGPHIHFEVMVNSISRRVNPLEYVK